MEFTTGLPQTRRQLDSIWVIVERVTKFMPFLAAKTTDPAEEFSKLHINKIVKSHVMFFYFFSYRGPQFTSHF